MQSQIKFKNHKRMPWAQQLIQENMEELEELGVNLTSLDTQVECSETASNTFTVKLSLHVGKKKTLFTRVEGSNLYKVIRECFAKSRRRVVELNHRLKGKRARMKDTISQHIGPAIQSEEEPAIDSIVSLENYRKLKKISDYNLNVLEFKKRSGRTTLLTNKEIVEHLLEVSQRVRITEGDLKLAKVFKNTAEWVFEMDSSLSEAVMLNRDFLSGTEIEPRVAVKLKELISTGTTRYLHCLRGHNTGTSLGNTALKH